MNIYKDFSFPEVRIHMYDNHLALRFTLNKETDYTLYLLDVLVRMIPLRYVMAKYPKLTFTGPYTMVQETGVQSQVGTYQRL